MTACEPIAVLSADWGGQILAVCPVRFLNPNVDVEDICRQVSLIEWDCNKGEDAEVLILQNYAIGDRISWAIDKVRPRLWIKPGTSHWSIELLKKLRPTPRNPKWPKGRC